MSRDHATTSVDAPVQTLTAAAPPLPRAADQEARPVDTPGRYLVNSADLDEAAKILGMAYGPVQLAEASAGTETRIRIWRTRVGPITLDDAEISDIRFAMDSARGVMVKHLDWTGVAWRIV